MNRHGLGPGPPVLQGWTRRLRGQDSDAFTAAGKRPLGSKDQSLGSAALLAR